MPVVALESMGGVVVSLNSLVNAKSKIAIVREVDSDRRQYG